MFTRRELLKLGLASGGCMLLGPGRGLATREVESPSVTPFVDNLPLPPSPGRVAPFFSERWNAFVDPARTQFFHIVLEKRHVQFHRDLPPTEIWGYRDANVPEGQWPFALGPTFRTNICQNIFLGNLVRFTASETPGGGVPHEHEPLAFGEARFTVHLHGGHHPSRSDGFPTDPLVLNGQEFRVTFMRGEHMDYFWPMVDPGFTAVSGIDPSERPSTLWYHDHILDFTGPNAYRGLAGFYLVFENPDPATPFVDRDGNLVPALDIRNEKDDRGLQLPSGNFDIPLVIQDKTFAADGSLIFDTLTTDGFLGDRLVVNGKIQPKLSVQRRRYRFRFLNGSNARFYDIFLANAGGTDFPMTMIATEGGLLSRAIDISNFRLAMAERVEVVVDFSHFPNGEELFFVDRMAQDDGRGPRGTFERPELRFPGTPFLKLSVEGGAVSDPSRDFLDPAKRTLRPFVPVSAEELAHATVRTFVFERRRGLWVINGEVAGRLAGPLASPSPLDAPEIWRFVNKSGGWWHPIHTHSEFGRVIRRKGFAEPPFFERDGIAKKDTVILGPNSEVEVFLKFRDYRGPFVFHCHNMEHEDHAMMARFDVDVAADGNSGFPG